jgi:pimeloyl-ACP methyl ester carboxylesterase
MRQHDRQGAGAGGDGATLEMYRARPLDAEQNRPHYANPISCPVLAVGAQAYLADQVASQLTQVATDVRGTVIPASGHNIALENPAALAEAYLDFFAGRGTRVTGGART